jgi:DNA-binding LacI/PurR family transcriptional regulator
VLDSHRVGHTTMDDVARRAKVSRSLVSLVMRGSPKVSEERRRRVLDAARALGYSPNAMARGLASRQSGIIAVLLNDLHNPFFAEIFDGLLLRADADGYQLLLGAGGAKRFTEQAALDSFFQFRPDGIVLVSPRLPAAAIATMARSAPVVVVGRVVKAPGVDVVVTDEAVGAGLVVGHLAGLGHQRIVHFAGGQGAGASARRRAFVKEMQRVGLGDRIDVIAGDFTEQSGVECATALLRRRSRLPTAIYAANDLAAIGAIDTLGKAGHEVPADISVIGFDNTFFSHLRHVSLTTIDQPRLEMGRLAMSLLTDRIGGVRRAEEVHLVTPTLVVRESTGPPPVS